MLVLTLLKIPQGFCPLFPLNTSILLTPQRFFGGKGGGFTCNHVQKDLQCGPAPCCGTHPAPPLLLALSSPLSWTSIVLEQAKSKQLRERLFPAEQRVYYSDLKKMLQSQK